MLIISILAGCSGEQGYRMQQLLAEADSMNRNYIPFTTDSAMKEAVAYFDRHGTANEQVKAHYLLGCVYRDLGEAPQALACFHDAVDRADTARSDCDYGILARVHGQMAMLFDFQHLPSEELSELNKAVSYALKADEPMAAYAYCEQKTSCYFLLGKLDSMLITSEYVSQQYRKIQEEAYANDALAPALYYYLLKGKYAKAKNYLDKYEYHSLLSQQSGSFKHDGWYLLYSYKALYNAGVGRLDSAVYYYQKQLLSTNDLNNQGMALNPNRSLD